MKMLCILRIKKILSWNSSIHVHVLLCVTKQFLVEGWGQVCLRVFTISLTVIGLIFMHAGT